MKQSQKGGRKETKIRNKDIKMINNFCKNDLAIHNLERISIYLRKLLFCK